MEDGSGNAGFWLPHIDVVCRKFGISKERLDSNARIAVEVGVIRLLVDQLVRLLPFDEEFYLKANPDVAEAYKTGRLIDLRDHYVTNGYFEGRVAYNPRLDAVFYVNSHADLKAALDPSNEDLCLRHYLKHGVCEGRAANPDDEMRLERWLPGRG